MSTSVSNEAKKLVPKRVADVADAMSGYRGQWALCGGWAADAWLGRETRDHGDVDIAVFQDELSTLQEHLAGWQLVAHDETVPGDTAELWSGRPLNPPAHLHARSPADHDRMPEKVDNAAGQGFGLDIQICERDAGDWICNREPRIGMPLASSIEQSAWGMPTLSPAVILFYKSRDLRRRDKMDFANLLHQLSDEQRGWLRDAISLLGHPWMPQL